MFYVCYVCVRMCVCVWDRGIVFQSIAPFFHSNFASLTPSLWIHNRANSSFLLLWLCSLSLPLLLALTVFSFYLFVCVLQNVAHCLFCDECRQEQQQQAKKRQERREKENAYFKSHRKWQSRSKYSLEWLRRERRAKLEERRKFNKFEVRTFNKKKEAKERKKPKKLVAQEYLGYFSEKKSIFPFISFIIF